MKSSRGEIKICDILDMAGLNYKEEEIFLDLIYFVLMYRGFVLYPIDSRSHFLMLLLFLLIVQVVDNSYPNYTSKKIY